MHVPHAKGIGAFQDPTHVRFFTLLTMDYFARISDRVPSWYGEKAFEKVESRKIIMPYNAWGVLLGLFINWNTKTQMFYEKTLIMFAPDAVEYHLIK